jgi:Zn-dependent protease with chaperone function
MSIEHTIFGAQLFAPRFHFNLMFIRLKQGFPKTPIHLLWGIFAVVAVVMAGIFKNYLETLPACVFKEATGIPCLTCGGTRSIVALSDLHIAQAFLFNPLLMMIFAASILFSLLVALGFVFHRRIEVRLNATEARIARIFVAAAIASNWAYLIVHLR